MLAAAFLLASHVAATTPAPVPPPAHAQVVVAGRWLSLPLPEGYCAFDQSDPTQTGFTESQWRSARDAGRRVLYPFVHCEELKGFRAKTRSSFSFGSFDAIVLGDGAITLPPETAPERFIASLTTKPIAPFDRAEIAALETVAIKRDDEPITRTGLLEQAPDALFLATFQRLPTGRKKNETMSAYGITGISVVAGVPLVVALMRYEASGPAVYDEMLVAEKAILAALRDANR
ncbi:MAG: hypothetical protein U1E87_03450 [Alphaproteobacteria bacterium]